jgi:hypothetical protein
MVDNKRVLTMSSKLPALTIRVLILEKEKFKSQAFAFNINTRNPITMKNEEKISRLDFTTPNGLDSFRECGLTRRHDSIT